MPKQGNILFRKVQKRMHETQKDFSNEKEYNQEIHNRTSLNEENCLKVSNKIYNALRRPIPIPIEKIQELIYEEYTDYSGELSKYKKMSAEQIRKYFWKLCKIDIGEGLF